MHRGVHVEGLFGQQCLIHEKRFNRRCFLTFRLEQVGPQHHDGGAFFNNCLNDFKPDEFFIYLT
ncbi:UNVERIFIED_ORG: hypothetical protein FHU01_4532 [Citrobacter freundii]